MGFISGVVDAFANPAVLMGSVGLTLLLLAAGDRSKVYWIFGGMIATLIVVLVLKATVPPPDPIPDALTTKEALKAWGFRNDVERLTGHNLGAIILLTLGLYLGAIRLLPRASGAAQDGHQS